MTRGGINWDCFRISSAGAAFNRSAGELLVEDADAGQLVGFKVRHQSESKGVARCGLPLCFDRG